MEQNVAQLTYFERLLAWFETSKKQVMWGVIILVTLAVIISYYLWNEDQKEAKAGEALSGLLTAAAMGGGTRTEPASAYLKIASEFPGTSAGGQAILLAGESLFVEGKYADAQVQFQRFIREYPGNALSSQAQLGIAACLDAQGKTDEAARTYKEVFERHPTANVVPQAKFALAKIYESQNKFDQARGLYQEIARGDTTIGSEAGMRLDELNLKAPAPVVAPPAVTPAMTNLLLQKPN